MGQDLLICYEAWPDVAEVCRAITYVKLDKRWHGRFTHIKDIDIGSGHILASDEKKIDDEGSIMVHYDAHFLGPDLT